VGAGYVGLASTFRSGLGDSSRLSSKSPNISGDGVRAADSSGILYRWRPAINVSAWKASNYLGRAFYQKVGHEDHQAGTLDLRRRSAPAQAKVV
jgi:hypothetical protein